MTTATPAFRVSRATRRSSAWALVGFALTALLASLPFWADAGWLHEFDEMACYLVFALMWNLLAGYGAMVSIGQQAFFGLGGYALFYLGNFLGLNPFVAVPVAALMTTLAAVPIAAVAFRLRGGYFAIGTWVIADVLRLSIANVSAIGGGSGESLAALRGIERATRVSVTFWLCLASAIAAIVLCHSFLRSRHGLALLAIRDSEVAAESQGINVRATQLVVYALAACGAGLSGALYFLGNLRISPDAAFSVNWSAFAIFIVLIGGKGTIEGPIVGAILFYVLRRCFSDFGSGYLVALGLLAIVATLRYPQGVWGALAQRYDLQIFPVQRRLVLLARAQPEHSTSDEPKEPIACAT